MPIDYVVTAMDYDDKDALNRRLSHRENHLSGLTRMKVAGQFLSGGAILDKEGRMIGSTAHVRFETKSELQSWLDNDPYQTGQVWDKIEVREIVLFKG